MSPPWARLFSTSAGTAFRRHFLVGVPHEDADRRVGAIAVLEHAFQSAGRIKRERRAEAEHRAVRHNAWRIGRDHRHGRERGAAAVRPALQHDAVRRHIGPRAQIAKSAIGIERPHRHLIERFGTLIVAASWKALRIAARAKAIDQDRHIAQRRPQAPPHLMTLRQGRGVVAAVGFGRIRAGATVHHHHGGRAAGLVRRKNVADEFCPSVHARECDARRNRVLGGGIGAHRQNDRHTENGPDHCCRGPCRAWRHGIHLVNCYRQNSTSAIGWARTALRHTCPR